MAASKKADPTIKSGSDKGPDYPEGTHPARRPSEGTFSGERFTYRDNPDKPDPTTKAQLVDDPLQGDEG